MKNSKINLFEVAQSQAGYFSAEQAESCGYSRYNFSHQVKAGNWDREMRGIYRLSQFPHDFLARFFVISLFFRKKNHKPSGVIALESALSLYNLSDFLPVKIFIAVDYKFRKSASIPKDLEVIKLPFDSSDYNENFGFPVMKPLKTVVDLLLTKRAEEHLVKDAFFKILSHKLYSEKEFEKIKEMYPSIMEKLNQWRKEYE